MSNNSPRNIIIKMLLSDVECFSQMIPQKCTRISFCMAEILAVYFGLERNEPKITIYPPFTMPSVFSFIIISCKRNVDGKHTIFLRIGINLQK